MKWLFCLICLGAGLLSGSLVKRWLGKAPATPASAPAFSAPLADAAGAPAASSSQTAWDHLMDRARTEALPEMTAILRQPESGPLGYLGRMERDLSLWREIDRGTDPGRIAAMLTDHNLLDSGAPRNGDWTALNMDITKFLLWQLGQRNPEASLEALARSNLQTLGPFFASWAETDLPAALKAADEHWVLLERVYSIAAALTSLAGRDPAGAIRLAASLRREGEGEGEGEDPVPGVLAGLGENHPRQALSFLLSPENQLSPEEVSGLVNLTVKKLAGEPRFTMGTSESAGGFPGSRHPAGRCGIPRAARRADFPGSAGGTGHSGSAAAGDAGKSPDLRHGRGALPC